MKESIPIDLETYSDVNITKCSAYVPLSQKTLVCSSESQWMKAGPVKVYDLACGDTIRKKSLQHYLMNMTKWAFSASFERICSPTG